MTANSLFGRIFRRWGPRRCETCSHWVGSWGITHCLEWSERNYEFKGDGVCQKHSWPSTSGNALAVCEYEGVPYGDFITKKGFGCNEHEFDRNYRQRLADENRAHLEAIEKIEGRK